MQPNELTSLQEFNNIKNSEDLVLVYFHSDKCSVCHSLLPKIINFCEKYHIELFLVDSNKYPEIPSQNLIMSFPALFVYYKNFEIIKMVRFVDLTILQNKINEFRNEFGLRYNF